MSFGYERAEDSVPRTVYNDNFTRIFSDYPLFSAGEKEMLYDFIKGKKYTKVAIYLTREEFGYGLDSDTVEFVIRELIRGNI
jgi:hypothetical protein